MPTSSALRYDVFVTEPIPVNNPYPLPNGEPQVTPPLASTLIFGDTDAVLVDVPATSTHADQLADWVLASGKRLDHGLPYGSVMPHRQAAPVPWTCSDCSST